MHTHKNPEKLVAVISRFFGVGAVYIWSVYGTFKLSVVNWEPRNCHKIAQNTSNKCITRFYASCVQSVTNSGMYFWTKGHAIDGLWALEMIGKMEFCVARKDTRITIRGKHRVKGVGSFMAGLPGGNG